jgi:uncharacterized glyoxalase superfamily protein PhnB
MGAKRKAPARPKRHKPETLRLRSLSPSLTVNDLQRSLAWYRDIVGFVVEDTWERDGKVVGASLKAGTVTLVLSQDDWAMGRDRAKGQGLRLHCQTVQDVDELAALIKARGGALASEPADQPWGGRAFSLTDPDGFKLTIAKYD